MENIYGCLLAGGIVFIIVFFITFLTLILSLPFPIIEKKITPRKFCLIQSVITAILVIIVIAGIVWMGIKVLEYRGERAGVEMEQNSLVLNLDDKGGKNVQKIR